MPKPQNDSFAGLVEYYLGMRLPEPMAASVCFPKLSPNTQSFIRRMLVLMRRANYSATGFTPHLIQWMSVTAPNILPGTWGGRIPPLTLPGRHKTLDNYVASHFQTTGNGAYTFLDLGCGFPPVTSMDTAQAFPDWHIYGVDLSFADFVLYDSEGHYACFDEKGGFQYFQALMNLSGRAMYADPQATRKRFEKLFAGLSPLLEDRQPGTSQTVEKDGCRLVHNHIRDFETPNLTFIQADIEDLNLPPATVIRCMNVLIYFTPERRKKMLRTIAKALDQEGILIAGTNGLGIQSRYTIYRKREKDCYPEAFAFGLDNLGPIVFMPWFTLHANDPEALLLTEVMGVVRSDRSFWSEFSTRIDNLLKDHGVCRRKSDGFFHFPEEQMPPTEYLQKNAELWQQMKEEEYDRGVVASLRKSGYDAWINAVGDIAIRPPAGALP